MLSPQQKTTTLVKILFRAAHTYSKDSKKKVSDKLVKKSGRPIIVAIILDSNESFSNALRYL